MPAGRIRVKLPDVAGPKAVIFERVTTERVPDIGKAWQNVATDLKRAFSSGRGVASIRLNIAITRTTMSIARGFAVFATAQATAHLVAGTISRTLALKGVPEVDRFDRAMGLLAGTTALVIERTMIPFAERVGGTWRAAARLPGIAMDVAQVASGITHWAANVVVIRLANAIAPGARKALALPPMPPTAGLERGGSTLPGRIDSGDPLTGFAAFTMPGGGLQFTSPQNVIAEGSTEAARVSASAALSAAVASTLVPALAPAISAALNDLIRTADAARAGAESRNAGLFTTVPRAMGDVAKEYNAAIADLTGRAISARAADRANEKIVDHPIWARLADSSRAAMGGLEASLRSAMDGATAYVRLVSAGFAQGPLKTMQSTMAPIDALTDALALDVRLMEGLTASSDRAAKAQQAAKLSVLVAVAAIQGSISFSQAVAETVSGSWGQAALHFAAAAAYAATGALAVARGGSGPTFRTSGADEISDTGVAQTRELVVILPGYSDPARIRDEIAKSIGSSGVGQGSRSFTQTRQAVDATDAVLAFYAAAWSGDRGRDQAIAGILGAIIAGPLGYTIGVMIGRYLTEGRAYGEAARTGRRVEREARRVRRRLGL